MTSIRTPPITEALQESICANIRDGMYPEVAAGVEGISAEYFREWMTKGQNKRKRARKVFREFAAAVERAQAYARGTAEVEAKWRNPLAWLTRGPGKERPGSPGWTTAIKPQPRIEGTTFNLNVHPEMTDIFGRIMLALVDHPEARILVGNALAELPERPVIEDVPNT